MFDRRTFLRAVTVAANGLAGLLLGVPGMRFLLSPLRRRQPATEFLAAAPINEIPPEVPLRVTLQGERRDAFLVHPSAPIGSVFLVRQTEPNDPVAPSHAKPPADIAIRCLHATCPHLGCAIQYSAERRVFECPCHASAFGLDGKVLSGPSLRAMDELGCRVGAPDAAGTQWVEVRYERFRAGTPERITLS